LYQPTAELIAKARGELEYLEEYTSVDDADRVNGVIDEIEKSTENGGDNEKEKENRVELERRLRAALKSLRDTTAWYDKTWAIGEWMYACVTYWACVTVIATMLVGILPIIHSQGNWNLCIVHWGVLGITGALLSILLRIHSLDVPELGETDGKLLLQGTVRSIAIGAVTAILLYAAIWGEALNGKVFPDLPTGQAESQMGEIQVPVDAGESTTSQMEVGVAAGSLGNVGLAIFWAIFAGLSPVILRRMSQVAESSLGELKSGNGVEGSGN
jgi:hypothetical protein